MSVLNIESYLNLLPSDIEVINISNRRLDYIPSLEKFSKLKIFICDDNVITSLPPLPLSLEILRCERNRLTSLPILPPLLHTLYCEGNQLTNLPSLPPQLRTLICTFNKLNSIPEIPHTLKLLDCFNNPLPFHYIKVWNIFNKFKNTFYKLKYGSKLERFFIKNIRNKRINSDYIHILYSPEYKFYKNLLNPTIQSMFK